MKQRNYAEIGVRQCGADDIADMLAIINAATETSRGVVPADRRHEPYIPNDELASEVANGVTVSGCDARGRLISVLGVQRRHNVDPIRYAYVLPEWQGQGIRARLLMHPCHADAPMS